jgi:hypothetical protein
MAWLDLGFALEIALQLDGPARGRAFRSAPMAKVVGAAMIVIAML